MEGEGREEEKERERKREGERETEGERERSRLELKSFYNLILELTYCYSCYWSYRPNLVQCWGGGVGSYKMVWLGGYGGSF